MARQHPLPLLPSLLPNRARPQSCPHLVGLTEHSPRAQAPQSTVSSHSTEWPVLVIIPSIAHDAQDTPLLESDHDTATSQLTDVPVHSPLLKGQQRKLEGVVQSTEKEE